LLNQLKPQLKIKHQNDDGEHLQLTSQNLYLNFSSNKKDINLNQITDLVKKEFGKFHLKRYDENNQIIEASFMVDSPKPEKLQSFTSNISKISADARVSFVESKSF